MPWRSMVRLVVDRAALLDRLLDQPVDRARRMAVSSPAARRCSLRPRSGWRPRAIGSRSSRYSATCASLTWRFSGRHSQTPRPARRTRRHDDHARSDDGGGAESERFETGGRQQQRQQAARDDDHDAAKRELQAPPIPDLSDDLYELRTVSAHLCRPPHRVVARRRAMVLRSLAPPATTQRLVTDDRRTTMTKLTPWISDSRGLFRWRAAGFRRAADTTRAPAGARDPAVYRLRGRCRGRRAVRPGRSAPP